jgi:tape measure domain-containing protein
MADNTLRIKIELLLGDLNARLQRLRGDLNNLGDTSGNQRLNAATQESQRHLDNLGQSGLGLTKVIQGLAGAFSVFALYAGGKKLIEIADNMKLIDGRIVVATASSLSAAQSAKDHTLAYAGLLDISQRTGTSFEANATLFARINLPMQQMGGSIKNALAFTEMLSKGLVISGAGASETASVIRQMSQAMASGVLRGDEFNSIMENSPRIAQALADGLGKNVGQLRAMAEAGELTAGKVMPALLGQAEKINAEYAKMPATVGRSFERVKNSFDQYIAGVDKGAGVTDGLASSFDNLAKNIVPVVEALATVGKVTLIVYGGQAIAAITGYVVAQNMALRASQQLAIVEATHSAALIENASMTVAATTARKLAIQADLQSAASRLALVRAEVTAAEAEVAATIGTTAHGNAVYRLNVAQQERAMLTAQVSVLGQEQVAVNVALTASTAELALAQEAANVSMLTTIRSLGAMKIAMGALNVAMSAYAGWEIGKWLNGFAEIRNGAARTINVLEKLALTHALVANVLKATVTGGSVDKVIAEYKEAIRVGNEVVKQTLEYNDALQASGLTAEQYSDTQIKVKTAVEVFTEKMAEHTVAFNKGEMSLDTYTKSLVRLHDEMKNATPATAFEKELDSLQQKSDKATLSPRDLYEKEAAGKTSSNAELNQLMLKFDELQAADQVKAGTSTGSKFDEKIAKGGKKFGYDGNTVMAAYEQAGAKFGVDAELLKAISNKETGGSYNPRIESPKGAVGLGQFMPATAKQFGLNDRTDPVASVYALAEMMSSLIKQQGSISLALAAYNGGGKGADYLARNPEYLQNPEPRIKGDTKHNSSYKVETADYVKKILESYDPDQAAQFNSEQKLQQNTQQAGFNTDKSQIDLTQKQADFESKSAIDALKQLKEAGKIGIKDYYDALSVEQEKAVNASIAATKAKLAQASKEHDAHLLNASPEDVPKIEADFKINQAQMTQELDHLQAELARVKPVNLLDAGRELLAEHRKIAEEEIAIKEQSDNDLLQIAETEAQQQLELGQLSNSKFLEKQREFEAERYQIALKAANDRRALLDNNDTSGLAKAEAEKNKIESDSAKTRAKINSAAIKEARKEFDDWVNPIKSALNSTITGILQGTLTLKQGMKNAFQSIALSYAQLLANKAINTAADWAFELIGFTAKEVTKGAIKTTSETVQTGATVAGVAARTATETAGAAASKTTGLAMSGASIMDAAAKAAAGTYASVAQIPYVGWILAPPAAALAFVAVAGYKSMLSSKGGEWNVADDGVRMIHEQETILPATIAAPMRDFFTKQGNPSYSLPDSATQPQTNQSATMATAASAIALQQSVIQAQQKQQRQSGGGTVVFNGKGGDFIHKNDLAKFAQSEKRNFRSS